MARVAIIGAHLIAAIVASLIVVIAVLMIVWAPFLMALIGWPVGTIIVFRRIRRRR